MIQIQALKVGLMMANCYIIYDDETLESLVVDPGGNPETIEEFVNNRNLKVQKILLTHGHGDHIGGVKGLAEALDVPVWVHEDDRELMESAEKNLSIMLHLGEITYDANVYFNEKTNLEFAGRRVKIIHTPGHTEGSSSFLIEKDLFVGDTLFFRSVGRTDLYAGNLEKLENSIKNKIYSLEEDVVIYPGHGPKTNVKDEKEQNRYVKFEG
ncbi:MAG: MBL fold metallo-hydrolase [Tissierellales bacterium]|jgi:glyoxylase-like metal-dependent hydrolase (beta-lactamase superfamily II)|nr:MBL fold metallo-hydrolase [Tissierellales bacterium]